MFHYGISYLYFEFDFHGPKFFGRKGGGGGGNLVSIFFKPQEIKLCGI
jgi:hypothetical protein